MLYNFMSISKCRPPSFGPMNMSMGKNKHGCLRVPPALASTIGLIPRDGRGKLDRRAQLPLLPISQQTRLYYYFPFFFSQIFKLASKGNKSRARCHRETHRRDQ